MKWNITIHSRVEKKLKSLPERVGLLTQLLVNDLRIFGFCPGRQWPNFGKLVGNKYHCHLIKGRPTYVACWELLDKSQHKIEVYYVGTHENAPY